MSNQRFKKMTIFLFLSTLVLSSCVQDNPEKEFIKDYNQLIEQAEWVPLTDLFEQVERRILIDDVYTYVSLSPSETASFCDEIVGNSLNLTFQNLKLIPNEAAEDKIIVGIKFKAFPNEQDSERFRATVKQEYKLIDDPDNRVDMVYFHAGFNETYNSMDDILDLQIVVHYNEKLEFPLYYVYTKVKRFRDVDPSPFFFATAHLVNEPRVYTIDEIYFKAISKETFSQLLSKYEAYDEEWSVI